MAINLCDINELLKEGTEAFGRDLVMKPLSMPDDFEALSDCNIEITDHDIEGSVLYLNLWTDEKIMRIGHDLDNELDLVAEFHFLKNTDVDNSRIFSMFG